MIHITVILFSLCKLYSDQYCPVYNLQIVILIMYWCGSATLIRNAFVEIFPKMK